MNRSQILLFTLSSSAESNERDCLRACLHVHAFAYSMSTAFSKSVSLQSHKQTLTAKHDRQNKLFMVDGKARVLLFT